MTTTGTAPNPPAPSEPDTQRRLRRNRTNRVGAGVAAGLGDYFGVDPVLFRVLFAASAFFGGAGVIAYLIAWAVMPEAGTERAVVDSWIGALRRRRVPPWLVAVAAGAILWAAALTWWTPAPFWPVLVVAVALVALYGRRSSQRPASSPAHPAVDLVKARETATDAQPTEQIDPPAATGPSWAVETRAWLDERRAASRERRRRSFPVRIAALAAIAVALVVLASVDTAHGVALPLYFVFVGGLALVGLLVGLVSRRTPWSLTALIVPSLIGLLAFGTTSASLRDGVGQRTWDPAKAPATSYRLAFGTGTLDLRDLQPQTAARTIHVTMAAGQVRILAAKTLNLTVSANVHVGNVSVDESAARRGDGGVEYNRIVRPPVGASGAPIKVVVRLADGNIDIHRR